MTKTWNEFQMLWEKSELPIFTLCQVVRAPVGAVADWMDKNEVPIDAYNDLQKFVNEPAI